ncbi:amidohydrolase family protein [Nostocoides sp. F2B08]|uniref:amidohydrolase family protein n=1 Tax=Nostocoides sp. F2B08 TaxID=2653936 RepID=UPI0012634421|nr:amidohydrolase family protein [Tetrasphaera sp. F2B08]KAB7746052.1 amidohydrolase family protein [Tetrasphaera sp. F2B08]
MPDVLHLRGPILAGPDDVRAQAWVADGRITYAPPPGRHDVRSLEGWVVPGLVDAHCHVGLDAHGAVDRETAEAQARQDRDHGTLLIRDAGSPADTRWIDERDDLPKIIRAGRHIARTRRYIRNYAHEVEPEQLVSRVRAEARVGDGWVKLVGDWIDRDAGDLMPCWPVDVLREAIQAAHEEGARVTAHCFGQESLYDFAAAGTDCIEHATGLEPETIESFARRGITIVPTLVNIATFPQIAAPAEERYPAYHRRMMDLHARRHETIGLAHEAGIRIYVGTDAGGSLRHGLVAEEVRELETAGLSRVEALGAATWAAREWLGRPGLDEGDPADVVVLRDDPREDLGVLVDPVAIVLRGRMVD